VDHGVYINTICKQNVHLVFFEYLSLKSTDLSVFGTRDLEEILHKWLWRCTLIIFNELVHRTWKYHCCTLWNAELLCLIDVTLLPSNKKLSYCRGIMQCTVPVKILSTAARKIHLKSLTIIERPPRLLKVITIAAICWCEVEKKFI